MNVKRIHPKSSKKYRPLVGLPYKNIFLAIADKLNETSMHKFDDLSAIRHAGYELWKRMFPNDPFPPEADVMRTQYHKDPGVG